MDEQRTSRQVIGARIRELREASGISQGELAGRAYVARQTVNNWETGKTLIDVQSLALVAGALGTTAGELLGERGAEAVRAEADLRHRLIVLLVGYGLLVLLWVALAVTGAALDNAGAETASIVANAAMAGVSVAAGACWFGLWHLVKEHDLPTATRLVTFLEGRDPAADPPRGFLYDCVLPHWRAWELLLWVPLVVMYVTVLLSAAA
ncbi:helix-turn-helix transcriptional regulator [Olsenella sp. An293]|uniref:helix-turn-helix domain-containing protein n=1 Tax=Olsenella sp. An293 TaxID=1965626 RepID=UPI000B3A73E1|nr:helix-turn-helix transcriptional regulator [Olsenella sp. An293]OUO32525.1 hypothetical protein B5F85_05940 [Olsenella sp. An293]